MLDPFVGAGTTVLRAKQWNLSATGLDLSPLSVLVTRAKVRDYDLDVLGKVFRSVLDEARRSNAAPPVDPPSPRLRKAFTHGEWTQLMKVRAAVDKLAEPLRDFFLLALLNVQQTVTRAVPDGGWFRWVHKPDQSHCVQKLFEVQVSKQLRDLQAIPNPGSRPRGCWSVARADARCLPKFDQPFDAVITSPPYPNRHDYSRVFHTSLLFLGMSEPEIRELRYSSVRSHVEARPVVTVDFTPPTSLERLFRRLPEDVDRRIVPMLRGYFEDMALCLRGLLRCLKSGGVCAFVVGNVRYAGVPVDVDEILAEIARREGFTVVSGWVARLRGNSAQQMGRFGRRPTRETILILRKQ